MIESWEHQANGQIIVDHSELINITKYISFTSIQFYFLLGAGLLSTTSLQSSYQPMFYFLPWQGADFIPKKLI